MKTQASPSFSLFINNLILLVERVQTGKGSVVFSGLLFFGSFLLEEQKK
jgi:hypothetical protein